MGHGKAPFHSGKSTGPYCPFKNFFIFLNGEDPARILAERDYFSKRVDELEDDKSKLEKDLSEALQAPFKKHKKKDTPENPKKRGAPVGHPGWFRAKPEQIDKTIDVYLGACPLCGSENISPCNHTTEHIQEDIEDGKLTSTCFIHCYYWCCDCKKRCSRLGVITKFPTPLSDRMSELKPLLFVMKPRLPITVHNRYCSTCAD